MKRAAERTPALSQLKRQLEGVEPQQVPILDQARRWHRDIGRASRFLQLSHSATEGILVPDAIAVFRIAGAHDVISADFSKRLETSATLWKNLRGMLQLIADQGWSLETASSESKAILAQACGASDFDALTAMTGDMSSRTAADIRTLIG